MARELPDSGIRHVRDNFDDAWILDQVRTGNLTPEDASAIFALPLEEGILTAPETIQALTDITSALGGTILGSLDDFVQAENLLAEELYGNVMGDYMAITESIEEMADRLVSLLRNDIASDLGAIDSSLDVITQAVLGVPTAQVQAIANLEGDISDKVFGFLGDQSELILNVLGRETDDILGELSEGWDLVQSTTEEIVTKTTDFASALRETIPEIGSFIGDAVEGVGEVVTTGFKEAASMIFDSFFGGISGDVVERIEPIIKMFEEELDVNPELRKITAPGILPVGVVGGLLAGIALPMIISSVGSTALSPFAEKLRQRMNALVRPSLMSPNEVVMALQRNDIPGDLAQNILDRQGLPDDQVETLRKLVLQKPDISTLVRWQSRGIISQQDFPILADQIGWKPEEADQFNEEYYGPPPVGDLIRMAVREVFSPEIAEEFGQFEEIPAAYLEWAEKIGLTTEWARNYWAAHWVLPSMQMGFEMLHRGAINADQLDALFVAQDVMPFWRDRLKEISYRVVTRVDVRRFHALGIYDDAQVLDAYMKMGFNETNAAEMTQFTVAYNDSTKKGEKARERDLSKSDVIGMYNDGVLDAATTRGYLIQLGYSEAEATVLIEREDIQEMRRERKADISNIIDQAKIKALTYEEAQDRLAALDLTRTETNKALADLARVSQTRTRTPSKSDLDDWLGLNLITEGDYAEELRTLGYADRYVALYVEATSAEAESDLLAEEEKAARRREPRSVSKSNLDSLYQAEIIDLTGYTEGLQTLGYREADIANLLEQQTLKLEERQRDELERLERGEEAAVRERLPSRSLLGKLFLKGLISIEDYAEGLTLLGFSPENIELLSKLIGAKAEEDASQPAGVT